MGTITEDSIVRLGTSIAQDPNAAPQAAPNTASPQMPGGQPPIAQQYPPMPSIPYYPPATPANVPPLPGTNPPSIPQVSPYTPAAVPVPTPSPAPVQAPAFANNLPPLTQPQPAPPLEPLPLSQRTAPTPAAAPTPVPAGTNFNISMEAVLEINALLMTLKHLTEPMMTEKEKKKGFLDEGAFRLTSAFMKGCKEAGLNSESTQKLLDELLGIAQEQQPSEPTGLPRQFDPIAVIAVSIQRKLPKN